MDDLISRQAAIDELVRWGKIPEYGESDRNMIACTIGMLSSLPSAEPERKWIGIEFDEYACSSCGCVVEDEEPTWSFCPNCGADMRGDYNG